MWNTVPRNSTKELYGGDQQYKYRIGTMTTNFIEFFYYLQTWLAVYETSIVLFTRTIEALQLRTRYFESLY